MAVAEVALPVDQEEDQDSGGSGYRRVGDDRTANLKVDNITSRSGTDGTEVDGIVEVNTTAHFIPPSGTTAEEVVEVVDQIFNCWTSSTVYGKIYIIWYLTISTLGNGNTFGDVSGLTHTSSVAFSTRYESHGYTGAVTPNTIEYVEIHSTGNAFDFGDNAVSEDSGVGVGNEIRGLIGGGSSRDTITYFNIATKGNASVFGNLTRAHNNMAGIIPNKRNICGWRWNW